MSKIRVVVVDDSATMRGLITAILERDPEIEVIGTGPYKFVEYKPDSHVKLARYDGYAPNPKGTGRDGFAGIADRKIDEADIVLYQPAAA